ncbi:MAG: aldo/keto reductase [Terriglobales bacterium]|jgi:aryl-alcohol dehydrogenase-like predicted oxidoreductase
MDYIELGATDLRVSRLGVGTAAFGLDRYGIPTPGEGSVDPAASIANIHRAVEGGVNFFDTAPAYGRSEELLGKALADHKDCLVATKVPIPENIDEISQSELAHRVNESLDESLRKLRREVLDVVQIHNATVHVLQQGNVVSCLERAREAGKLRFIGASVYGEEAALAAIRTGKVQVLQVALSLLDQRMRDKVIPEAKAAGVGVLSRSVLLKGTLTKRAQWLPPSLLALSQASERAVRELGTSWESLPSMALRFCLSVDGVHCVLSGVRNSAEVEDCLAACAAGPIAPVLLAKAYGLALSDERLLNPSHWQLEKIDTYQAQL